MTSVYTYLYIIYWWDEDNPIGGTKTTRHIMEPYEKKTWLMSKTQIPKPHNSHRWKHY